ncbi:MAG: DNA modification system-associated small protein [Clostridiaceae bacterium]|nr:DNA modification system-associated small protein [Clostridiaceae bacterium]
MNLSFEDKEILKELSLQNQVSYDKVLKLLDTVQEYELKERRTGVYDALREILRSNFVGEEKSNEV